MFEIRTLVWTMLVAACVVRGAWGQDLDHLRARADSLALAWDHARLLADLRDSVRRGGPPPNMERMEAGALTVLADPSRLPLQHATQDAWRQLDAFYGSAAATLAGRPLVLRVLTARETRRPGQGERWVLATDDLDAAQLTALLVRNAPLAPADPALHDWLAVPLVAPADTTRERAVVYVDLVTSDASVGHRCFNGDLAACRIALSLLESIPPATLPRPLGPMARITLTQLALERGGREAYTRLLADSALGLADRLAAASGMTPDALIAAWHRAIIASRPSRVTLPWLTAFVVFGWIGVFVASALSSSRWRF